MWFSWWLLKKDEEGDEKVELVEEANADDDGEALERRRELFDLVRDDDVVTIAFL